MIHENYSEEVDEEEEEEEEPEVYHESPRYMESTMNRREEYYRNNVNFLSFFSC